MKNAPSGEQGLWPRTLGNERGLGYLSHHCLPVSWCTLRVLQAVSERVTGAPPIHSTATATQVQNLPHRPLKSGSHEQVRNTGGALSGAVSGTISLPSDKPHAGPASSTLDPGVLQWPHTDRDDTTAVASPVVPYKEARGALQWANGRTPSRSSQNLGSLG